MDEVPRADESSGGMFIVIAEIVKFAIASGWFQFVGFKPAATVFIIWLV